MDERELELQKEAVRLLGMDTQLLHAVEELTELSLAIQRHLRRRREGVALADYSNLTEEYCDARNGLATVELFLLGAVGSDRIEREQHRKNAKFAEYITAIKENDHGNISSNQSK